MRRRYEWSIKLPIFLAPAHSPPSLLALHLCISLVGSSHVSPGSAALVVHGPGAYRVLTQQHGTWILPGRWQISPFSVSWDTADHQELPWLLFTQVVLVQKQGSVKSTVVASCHYQSYYMSKSC